MLALIAAERWVQARLRLSLLLHKRGDVSVPRDPSLGMSQTINLNADQTLERPDLT